MAGLRNIQSELNILQHQNLIIPLLIFLFLIFDCLQSINMESKHYNKKFRMKTEKAIEIINIYENNHSQVARLSLIYGSLPSQELPAKISRLLEQSKWKKLQFLENERKFYELEVSQMKDDAKYYLKLVFKDFTGNQIAFSLSTREDPIPKEECEFKVQGEKILKVNQMYSKGRKVFLTFHASDLTLFKFKYEFVWEEESSIKQTRAMSESKLKILNLPIVANRFVYAEMKSQRSELSLSFKNQLKSPRSIKRQELVSGRLKYLEHQKEKMVLAKEKKQDLSIYKGKLQELKIVSQKCRGLLQQYEIFTEEQKAKEQVNQILLLKFLTVMKFLKNCHTSTQLRSDKIKEALRLRAIVKKAALKFMQVHKEIKRIAPYFRIQQLMTIRMLIVEQAKMVGNLSCKKAERMVLDCLTRVSPRAIVNNLLVKATLFRSKMRSIQKFWRQRNQAQIVCFLDFINHQLLDLYRKNPHLQSLSKEFYQINMNRQLSWQYLTESTMKLNIIIGAYVARMEEIEDLKHANEQIRDYNKKALKKHQKKYLEVPKTPSYPITRYFRDIHILKSMVRSWFEIQYRKYAKKNRQEKSRTK